MHRLSAKQNELNSTDPENNLGVGAVNVWELRISALNAGRFDAYNPHAGLVVFWVKLRQRGYTRSISGLYRILRRIDGKPMRANNRIYKPP